MNPIIALQAPDHTAWQEVLTPRQAEIAELVAACKHNREIANELVVTEQTVKFHISCILVKLGLHNRMELARWWWVHIERPILPAAA